MTSTWSAAPLEARNRPTRTNGGERSFLGHRSATRGQRSVTCSSSLSSSRLPRLSEQTAQVYGTAAVVQHVQAQREQGRARTGSVACEEEVLPMLDTPRGGRSKEKKAKEKAAKKTPQKSGKDKEKEKSSKDKDKEVGGHKKFSRSLKGLLKKEAKVKEEVHCETPEEYIEFLQGGGLDKDKDELCELCCAIQHEPEQWIAAFVAGGGVAALFALIQPPSACKDMYVAEMYAEALRCVIALTQHTHAHAAILAPDNLVHVVLLLMQPSPLIAHLATALIQSVLRIDSGYAIVHNTLELVSKATGGRSLLHPFLIASSVDGDTASHRVAALAAITEVLQNVTDLPERWALHIDLLKHGLYCNVKDLFANATDHTASTLLAYEHLLTEDHDEMCTRVEMPHLKSDGTLSLEGNFFSVDFSFVDHPGSAIIPVDGKTLFADVINILNARQAYLSTRFSPDNFGLYLCAHDKWVEPSDAIGDFEFDGAVQAEFRLKHWKLKFDTAESDYQLFENPKEAVVHEMDPHDLIDIVLGMFVDELEADESEEWGILWVDKDTWLDRTRRLCDYDLFDREQIAALSFRRAPISLSVQFRGRSLDFTFSNECTALHISERVTSFVNIPPDQQGEYCIFDSLNANAADPTEGMVLDHELIGDIRRRQSDRTNFVVQLRVKPQAVQLYPPQPEDSEETPDPIPMRLLFKKPMGESHALICKSLNLEPEQYHLYWKTENGEVKGLFRWSSLKDQGVPYGSDLVLMKKPYTDIEEIIDGDEDDNIWDEDMSDATLKTEEDNSGKEVILCGTLNRLVRLLTNETKFDSNFVNTFLLTYRSFTTPEKLLKKLLERYDVSDEVMEEAAEIIKMRVCVVLKRWVESFNDEKETQLIGELSDFIDGEIETGPTVVANVRKALMKVKRDGRIVQTYCYSNPPPPLKLPKNLKSFTFTDVPALELARQLCLMTFSVFKEVKPFEFFNQAWSKPKYQHLCPNVMKMIEIFNDVSNWVGSAIVLEETVRTRGKVMEHFIMVAKYLRDLNNYHLLQAVVSGMNSSSILRLKWTRARLSKHAQSVLTELEALTNMENSYKAYRNSLVNSDPPLIPYFGVYLADLTFIEDGNPDNIDNLIHFAKRQLVYKLLSQVSTFQVKGYNLKAVPELQEFLSDLPILDEKEMYAKSLEREPRNATRADIQ